MLGFSGRLGQGTRGSKGTESMERWWFRREHRLQHQAKRIQERTRSPEENAGRQSRRPAIRILLREGQTFVVMWAVWSQAALARCGPLKVKPRIFQ